MSHSVLGRIERLWEKKGQKIVNVRWYYHPEEVKTKKRIVIKYPVSGNDANGLFNNRNKTMCNYSNYSY